MSSSILYKGHHINCPLHYSMLHANNITKKILLDKQLHLQKSSINSVIQFTECTNHNQIYGSLLIKLIISTACIFQHIQ